MLTKGEQLAKNTFIIFLSKFSTQILSFLILPIVTSKLSTEEYGSFDLISTYSWLFAAFMSLQIENGIFRFLIDNRKNEKNKKIIITTGITIILLQTFVFILIYLLFRRFINFKNDIYILFVSVSVLILNIPLQISRGIGNNFVYAIASIITGVSNILFSMIFIMIFNLKLLGIVMANIISNILGGCFIICKEKIYSSFEFKWFDLNEAKNILKYSIPLMPNNISSWIISISDKIMISFFVGISANGIYSIATKFSILLSHIYSVFNLSWTESASINANEKDRNLFYSKTIDRIYMICTSICLFMIAAMPIMFKILINSKYNDAYKYIPILILACFFEIFSGLIGSIYISFKFPKKLAYTTLIGALINIIINYIYMRKYGIIVACISTIISYVLVTLIRIIDLKKYIKLRLEIKKYIILVLTTIIITILYYYNSIIVSIISIMITIIVALYLNKEVLKVVLDKCRKMIINNTRV